MYRYTNKELEAMHAWPEFAGKTILVSGGGVGFGLDLARLVAANGGTAWICGRDGGRMEERQAEATKDGLDIRAARADVTSDGDVSALFARILEASGRLDGLVCAAGSGVMGTIEEIDAAAWEKTVSSMLRGVYLPTHAAVRAMAGRGGSIVLVSSVHAYANVPRRDAIAAATAGILGLVRGTAVSMSGAGIRINSVSPGPVETPTWRGNWERAFPKLPFEEIARRVGASIPMGRIGQAEDISEPIAFLLSERSRYVTGIDLRVDGGLGAKLAMASQLD